MSLRKDLKEKSFIVTAELNPPKGSSPAQSLANASKIKNLVSAINITDNSGAAMKMCPLVLSYLIQKDCGVETIWQMTCRDRNRLALQSDLLGSWALGLKNILPLRGDAPQGALKEEKCFDLGTEELLKAIQEMKGGRDLDGNELKEGAVDFCVGSAAHPGLPDLKMQKETMLRRIDSGVEFFQTQICFEIQQIDKFVSSIGEELASKTILGITPLKTARQADFMNKNIFGVTVPEEHIQALEQAGDKQQEAGLKIAKELIDHIKQTPLKGVHLMAIGQENVLDTIIQEII